MRVLRHISTRDTSGQFVLVRNLVLAAGGRAIFTLPVEGIV